MKIEPDELVRMVKEVDDDGTGEVEFEEFVVLMQKEEERQEK